MWGFERSIYMMDKGAIRAVWSEGVFPEPVRSLSLRERFERSIYMMDKGAIRAVWSEGRCVY